MPATHPAKSRIHVHTKSNDLCNICNLNHKTQQCNKLKAANVNQRKEILSQNQLCFSCLGKGHYLRFCPKKTECKLNGCKSKHHRLLHQPKQQQYKSERNNHHGYKKDVYFQIIPVKLSNKDKVINTFAFLDPGSSLSLIDEAIADQLGLDGKSDPLCLTWTQNLSKETPSKRVNIQIQGKGKQYVMKGVRTIPDLQLPKQSLKIKHIKKRFEYLADLDIDGYHDAKPTILIGLEHPHLLMTTDRRHADENSPMAVRTKLGWLIFGKICREDDYFSMSIKEEKEAENLSKMLEDFCSLENFGVKIIEELPKSKDDERTEKILNQTLNYKDGHYELGLLWKNDKSSFPPSYNNALNRLKSLERSLMKNPELKDWANEKFRDFLEKGYARQLSPAELMSENPRIFYLPHFIVINKNKVPPKPRVVFDAAAEVQGISFNSELMTGPDNLMGLFGVLLRFREHSIAVSGDIMEMFQQIKIIKEDQYAQRYLWRNCNPDAQPNIYVMESMIFGSTCSPACAQAVKNYNAKLFENQFPVASTAIVNQHYVDDYLDSFSSMEEAIKTVNEIIKIHQYGGFFIRNFISNKNKLINHIPKERVQIVETKQFEHKDSITEKVLGVFWNIKRDSLQYRVKFDKLGENILRKDQMPTKREVLSFVMSIYDPLGLISNFIIHGKILLQRLHKETSDWDTPISERAFNQWKLWLQMMNQVSKIEIPRCVTHPSAEYYELHTFVDASEDAFAAVVYLRNKTNNGAMVTLIAAKSRVAPLKKISIPRLELQGAVLGTRLMNTVKKELRLNISRIIMWTDSQTVLAWINSEHRKYKQFVAYRVAEILETTYMDQWRYVPSNQNPADEGTKIVKKNPKWFSGPSFLSDNERNWPSRNKIGQTVEEIRNYVSLHNKLEKYSFIKDDHFSDFWKLKRHVNIFKQFVKWIVNKGKPLHKLCYEDMVEAENILFKKAQWECFNDEVVSLTNSNGIDKSSRLRELNPFLDQNGVLRAKGRLEKAVCLSRNARTPIILPYEHYISFLVVKTYHEKYFHYNDNAVIAAIQQKYWILKCRSLLKKVKKYCQKCILNKAKPSPPMMSTLPDFRTQPFIYPFTNTGVDYFGPLEVMIRRSVEKRWGVIFTCMSSRAVHIELAEKLDTDSFFVCLRNFQNRRGKIKHLFSDNGTNFVGAARIIKTLIDEINEKMDNGEAAKLDLKWTFNPPAAPHFGGAWERLIRIIKQSLNVMLQANNGKIPKVEELRAALIQAEFILNSRPLTHIPVDNIEDEVLTPFHILIGRAGEYVPPYDTLDWSLNQKQCSSVMEYGKYFWNRFKKEYIPTLIKRNKWNNKVDPIKIDDLVLIVDEKMPPGSWLKGRVIQVNTADDGQVRSALIQTKKGVYSRPTTKIAVVDVNGMNIEPINEKSTNSNLRTKETKKNNSVLLISCEENKEDNQSTMKKNNAMLGKRKGNQNMKHLAKRAKSDMDNKHETREKLHTKSEIKQRAWLSLVVILSFIALIAGFESKGLIAYDCANPEVNMTSYSLLDVESCVPHMNNLSSSQVSIQVLQRNVRTTTRVFQCKVIIKRSIKHCGAFSHVSEYQYGYSYIVKEFNSEECRKVHALGTVALTHDRLIHELKLNTTTHGETLIIGSLSGSKCYGGTYSTPFYTWTNALVFYEYEISLFDYIAHVDIENDQISLRKGLYCPYSLGRCLDSEEGYLTWDMNLNKSCEDTEFEVIYEGLVNKTMNSEPAVHLSTAVIYSTISESQIFSIKTRKLTRICGYSGFTTDHPRILIIENSNFKSPFSKKVESGKNLDLFTYFNSKITIVEHYIGQNLNDIYNMVMTEMCKLDRTIMETKLTLARLNPNEFVSSIMKGNGYTAVVAGEVLHVLECKPVYVSPKASERCYQELPVNYNNITMYLAPVTRILQTRGTEIDCTPLLPVKFKFGSRWYTTDGRLRESTSPNKLSTNIVTSWNYTPLPNLMESGVYDSDNLVKMRNMIYEQGEKRAASAVVYKIMAGQHPNRQGFQFEAMISEKVLDNVFSKYWKKLISWTTWLGNLTSTAIGLYLIVRIIKFFVDTLIHGRILYDIYGFSWKLIASCWDSLTSLLSHKKFMEETKKFTKENDRTKDLESVKEKSDTKLNENVEEPYRASMYPTINKI
ncbi:uncharacterized protein LOC134285524 [Aedes albopictus]|uniref:Integrase catalytic domain-containing protein n=1 Tax=Aedes albopictus TaxID=7160 RepID=A0ABM1ZEK8_AEDAL